MATETTCGKLNLLLAMAKGNVSLGTKGNTEHQKLMQSHGKVFA